MESKLQGGNVRKLYSTRPSENMGCKMSISTTREININSDSFKAARVEKCVQNVKIQIWNLKKTAVILNMNLSNT